MDAASLGKLLALCKGGETGDEEEGDDGNGDGGGVHPRQWLSTSCHVKCITF